MKKKRLTKKGFTMIELMIVITVIGILAIVLLPRITGVRDEARVRGVESNLRSVQGLVEMEIAKATTQVDLATRLNARFGTGGSNILTNPLTGGTGFQNLTGGAADMSDLLTDNAVVVDPEAEITSDSAVDTDLVGVVVVETAVYNNRLRAYLYGFDHEGSYIEDSYVVIER